MWTAIALAAQIVASSPPLSPADAALVLARLNSPTNMTGRVECAEDCGPRITILNSSPTAGPYGEFPYVYSYYPYYAWGCCGVFGGYPNSWFGTPIFGRAPMFHRRGPAIDPVTSLPGSTPVTGPTPVIGPTPVARPTPGARAGVIRQAPRR